MTSSIFNDPFNYHHDPRLDDQRAIKLAVQKPNLHAVKCLLNVEYVDPTTDNNFAIKVAIKNGNVELVEALLDTGKIDPSLEFNYPLRKACKNGNLELVTFLLDYPDFDMDNVYVTSALADALIRHYDLLNRLNNGFGISNSEVELIPQYPKIARLMLSKIPLTGGDTVIMNNLLRFSKEGVEMIINDGYITLT
jgi:ankyrin repeat protein